jgi:hypothetical protein
MIGLSFPPSIFLSARACDMRKSIDGLCVNAQRRYPLFPTRQIDYPPVSPTAINVSKDRAAYAPEYYRYFCF